MKYSEAKAVIDILHIYGWYKVKGMAAYQKVWKDGQLRLLHTLDFAFLSEGVFPVSFILLRCEDEAERQFKEFKEKWGLEHEKETDITPGTVAYQTDYESEGECQNIQPEEGEEKL